MFVFIKSRDKIVSLTKMTQFLICLGVVQIISQELRWLKMLQLCNLSKGPTWFCNFVTIAISVTYLSSIATLYFYKHSHLWTSGGNLPCHFVFLLCEINSARTLLFLGSFSMKSTLISGVSRVLFGGISLPIWVMCSLLFGILCFICIWRGQWKNDLSNTFNILVNRF